MKTLVGKFSFKVPDTPNEQGVSHSEAGKKIEKTFEFLETENEQEALTVIADKKWSVKELVDENLKANARSSAYQTALAVYIPSKVSPEDIRERMIRDYVRLGFSEDVARKTVDAALDAMAATQ